MPTTYEILNGLTRVANEARPLAIAWHLALLAALVAASLGWRPDARGAARLVALLPASVAAVAAAFDNPFNALVFALLTGLLLGLAPRAGEARAATPAWVRGAGAALLAYAWCYPHFLLGPSTQYLYAAPLGLVPCPSLAAAIGLALVGGLYAARAWALLLAGMGVAYGVIGVGRLGVGLDVGLLVGAAVLAAVAMRAPVARGAVRGGRPALRAVA